MKSILSAFMASMICLAGYAEEILIRAPVLNGQSAYETEKFQFSGDSVRNVELRLNLEDRSILVSGWPSNQCDILSSFRFMCADENNIEIYVFIPELGMLSLLRSRVNQGRYNAVAAFIGPTSVN